jgi:DNA-binding LacI/PurR family transcriptional regulator
VPDDVSIVSFGDFPFASFLCPSITTVRQDFAQVGLLGFECLMSLVENPGEPPLQLEIEPELKIRESTAPAAQMRRGNKGPSSQIEPAGRFAN